MQRIGGAIGIALIFIVIGYQSSSFTFASVAGEALTSIQGALALARQGDGSKSIFYGGCDTDPYEALKPYISGAQIVPKQGASGQLVDGIDPALACRLSKFLPDAQKVCSVKIISGYRSPEQQQAMCGSGRTGCAAAGRSCHQYGLAIDLSSDCNGKLRDLSKKYELHFPYSGNHVQCAEHRFANRLSCRGPCKGGVAITRTWENAGNGSSETPSSSAADKVREALGLKNAEQQQQEAAAQAAQQQATLQQNQQAQALCTQQGGTWQTSNYTTGQGYCQPKAATNPTLPTSQTASSQGTSGTTGSSGTTNTASSDPVLACAQEASNPVCGKQTTCPSIVSPSDTCTVGAKKTYLNTCLMNVDNAALVAQGACPASTQDQLTVLAEQGSEPKESKPQTTIELVPDTTENLGALADQQTNAFTAAPKPGTPSYDEQRIEPQGGIAQQTFGDANVIRVSGSPMSGQQTHTTFVSTALDSIVSALKELQHLLTPMQYTMNASGATEHAADAEGEMYIYEDDIPIEEID